MQVSIIAVNRTIHDIPYYLQHAGSTIPFLPKQCKEKTLNKVQHFEKLKQLCFPIINITNICCRNCLAPAQFCEEFFVIDKYFSTFPIMHHSTQTFSLIILRGVLSYLLKKGNLLPKRMHTYF